MRTRLLIALMLLGVCFCRPAQAEIRARLTDGSGGRSWEMIVVEFAPTPGEVDVSAQDARGGMAVVRRVPGSTGKTWLALPLLAHSQLVGQGGGVWPVDLEVRSAASDERARLNLRLGLGGGRTLVPAGMAALWPPAGTVTGPGTLASVVEIPEEDLLSAPAILFAACDTIVLSPSVLARLSDSRKLDLLAAGVTLTLPPGMSDSAGSTSLLWDTTPAGKSTPNHPLPRPALVEPGLASFPDAASTIPVPAAVSTALLLLGPAALVVLILARGLFHRRAAVLLASALALAALAVAMIVYLRLHSLRQQPLGQWSQARASDSAPVGGILLEERLARCDALFGGPISCAAEPLLFPVARNLGEYWNLRPLRLVLATGITRLEGTLPARSTFFLQTRLATSLGMLPAFPRNAADQNRLFDSLKLNPADAFWLVAGYVNPAAISPDSQDAPGLLFAQWAADKPWAAAPGTSPAWYPLRFEPARRYLLFPRQGQLVVIDFPSSP